RNILDFIGADRKFIEYGQLELYLEQFLAATRPDMLLNDSERRRRNAALDIAQGARYEAVEAATVTP
ncbi:MAG TPA: hypothetical protein VMY35_05190, partial [Phycisphaerae bacterium]|nr:hypothetical protein [Phycisphaerae bacterium]